MSNETLKSPLQTIRQHCLDCGGSVIEVKLCPVVKCALWPFRFGHDPRREKRVLTPEQRQILVERMVKVNRPVSTGNSEQGGHV